MCLQSFKINNKGKYFLRKKYYHVVRVVFNIKHLCVVIQYRSGQFFNSKIFYWREKTIVIVIFVSGDYRAQVHVDK